jgi:hypothetical protein
MVIPQMVGRTVDEVSHPAILRRGERAEEADPRESS